MGFRLIVYLIVALTIFLIVMAYTDLKMGERKIRLNKELKLPMQYREYTHGTTLEFKTEEGMPCIAFTIYKGAGLSCDWNYKERE